MADRPDSFSHDADDDAADDPTDADATASLAAGDGRDGPAADGSLTKSDLIELLAREQNHLAHKDVELAVKSLLEKMSQELAAGERIEIRGFGSFSLHFRGARMGRNPKSGDAVALRGKYVPHFKPGKELRERVNAAVAHADASGTTDASSDGAVPAHDDRSPVQREAGGERDDARD